jgi:hypothetical protein
MKAGWSEIDITPPLGTALGGDPGRDHGYQVVYDPAMAQVLALEDQAGARLGVVTLDVTGILWRDRERIAAAVEERCGLPPHHLLLNCSHSHSAPALEVDTHNHPPRDLYACRDRLAEYRTWFLEAVAGAVGQALRSLRPAKLFFGKGQSGVGISRRLVVDGKAQFMPSPEGFYDRDLAVVAVGPSADDLRALLFVHGCHATTRYGGEHRYALSADYPGAARRHLNQALGQRVLTMFGQGAGADIRPPAIDENGRFRAGTHEDVDKMGAQLAQDVVSVLRGHLREIENPRFAATLSFAGIPLQPPPAPQELERLSQDPEAYSYRRLWADRLLAFLGRGECVPAYLPLPIQVLRLDSEHLVVGLGHEVVSKLGAMVKEALAPAETALMAYCNAAEVYIPTAQMLSEGGYEPEGYMWGVYPAPVAECVDEVILAKVREIVRKTEAT